MLAVANDQGDIAWTAAVNLAEGFIWYSLKDPRQLPLMVMWIENRGRHGDPWNGRNTCLGLEDGCGYFADGLFASAHPNALSRQGIPTALKLTAARPTVIRHIQGVAPLLRGFERVERVEFDKGRVTFIARGGKAVRVDADHEFLVKATHAFLLNSRVSSCFKVL